MTASGNPNINPKSFSGRNERFRAFQNDPAASLDVTPWILLLKIEPSMGT